MKNILVIHPKDETTDCLCALYQDRDDCDIIRDPSTDVRVIGEAIESHDRILLLGHGTPYGLLTYDNLGRRFGRYIVDVYHKPLFADKQVWSIWCNSDQYFKNVPTACIGIHTGMIISERSEELYTLNHAPLSVVEMEENMKLFCEAFRKNIDFDNPEQAQQNILAEYVGNDEVTEYNRKRILII